MSSTPKVGDRVAVAYEGVVTRVTTSMSTGRQIVRANRDNGDGMCSVFADYVTVIEPAYEVGSVYMSGNGVAYYRLNKANGAMSWRHVSSGILRHHNDPIRPLRKLVPEADE